MTTNPTPIPETKVAGCARCDRIEAHALGIEGLLGRRRDQLAKAREEIIRLTDHIAELEGSPALSEEQVEALRCADKWLCKGGLAVFVLRDAFPDAFAEPEPGADIPEEVVEAALEAYWDHYAGASSVSPNGDPTAVRLALAAADAKRAELEGGEQGMSTAELHKCACCEGMTADFFCRECETAGCCMINGAKCGRF